MQCLSLKIIACDKFFSPGAQVIYHVTILGKKLKFPETTPEGYRELGEACLDADPEKRPTFAQILRKLNEL